MTKPNKTPMIVVGVVLLSFAYGVGSNWLKNQPEAPLEEVKVEKTTKPEKPAPVAAARPATQVNKTQARPKPVKHKPLKGSAPINPYAEMMKKMGQNKNVPKGKAPPHPLDPNNPHPYLHPSQASKLSNTLDSIRPGQIEEKRLQKRNLYFEKLSEQLKELQGKQKNQPVVSPPVPDKPEKGENLDQAEPGENAEEMGEEAMPEGAPAEDEEFIDDEPLDDEEFIDEDPGVVEDDYPEDDFVEEEGDIVEEGF